MLKNLVKKFSIIEIIVIALIGALGIATKPVIVPFAHIITGPLYIPGGAVAGGLYMMWIVLGLGLVGKVGTATLISIVQAIMVVSLGIYGTHGIVSFFTYIIPGLVVDLYVLFTRRKELQAGDYFIGGILANISGTFLVNLVFFRLPLIPLVLTLASASLSGGIGGLIAYGIIKNLKRNQVIKNLLDRGGHDE